MTHRPTPPPCQCKYQRAKAWGYELQTWSNRLSKWSPLAISDFLPALMCIATHHPVILLRCRGCNAELIRSFRSGGADLIQADADPHNLEGSRTPAEIAAGMRELMKEYPTAGQRFLLMFHGPGQHAPLSDDGKTSIGTVLSLAPERENSLDFPEILTSQPGPTA